MADASPHQLFLLADHIKLSLLERQRAISLDLEPHRQDGSISRSLVQLQAGVAVLDDDTETSSEDLGRLRQQYNDLHAQFHGSAPPPTNASPPNNAALAPDFAAARSPHPRNSSLRQKRPPSDQGKSVRFRDDPNSARDDAAGRAALFNLEPDRYRDEPATLTQPALDNQQLHHFHTQVLAEQDEQLDELGRSIGRQRILGIQMGNELDEQVELLDEVDAGVERHQDTLDRARKRLGGVARKAKDNWTLVTIGILICILVLLIIVLK